MLTPVYARVLGAEAWAALPGAHRAPHEAPLALGEADINRGAHPLARLAAWLAGFPPAGRVNLRLLHEHLGTTERWTRHFGRHSFRTSLRARDGLLVERFGPLSVAMELMPVSDGLRLAARRCWLLGLPVPLALAPQVTAHEKIVDGRFHFDVALAHAWTGPIVRYRGWLAPSGLLRLAPEPA